MIVLNRRKRSVDFIPAGSPRGALNTRRKPGYWGKLKIKKTSSGPRIARFTVEKMKGKPQKTLRGHKTPEETGRVSNRAG